MNRCSSCGNPIQEDEPVIRMENKYRRSSVQFFHADYTGCAEAESRVKTRDHLSEDAANVLDTI